MESAGESDAEMEVEEPIQVLFERGVQKVKQSLGSLTQESINSKWIKDSCL